MTTLNLNLKASIITLIITPDIRSSQAIEIMSGRTCILEIDKSSKCWESNKNSFKESTESFKERDKGGDPFTIEDTLLKNNN